MTGALTDSHAWGGLMVMLGLFGGSALMLLVAFLVRKLWPSRPGRGGTPRRRRQAASTH
jgi:hypothetical protein